MHWILFFILCIFISYITVNFPKYIIVVIKLLLTGFLVGIITMLFKFDLGVSITIWSIALLIVFGIVVAVSSVASALIVAPLILIWSTIKSLFKK
jgi:hypothetical protein